MDATLWLEATLALDADHPKTRELLAQVIHARALEAERDRRDDAVTELVARLEAVAPHSALLQSWKAPARLDVNAVPRGAALRLERYERRPDGRMMPVAVTSWPTKATVPAGSYRVVGEAPGRASIVLPILLARGEQRRVELALPKPTSVPKGFVFVPAGSSLYGSTVDEDLRSVFFKATPLHAVATNAYLIARYETTFAQWIDYLNRCRRLNVTAVCRALAGGDRSRSFDTGRVPTSSR